MAQFTSEYKRAFLRAAKTAAEKTGCTLLEYLTRAQSGRITQTEHGYMVASTSGAGRSVSFFAPTGGTELTPVSLAELCEELITAYEDQQAAGLADEPTIYANVMALYRYAVKSFRPDFSGYGGTYGTE